MGCLFVCLWGGDLCNAKTLWGMQNIPRAVGNLPFASGEDGLSHPTSLLLFNPLVTQQGHSSLKTLEQRHCCPSTSGREKGAAFVTATRVVMLHGKYSPVSHRIAVFPEEYAFFINV